MVLPAQFQLGLELTNIVNPIGQAMSALGSLAVIDAIKKSGSDFITETKLANLIGRHRIDPIIKFHFRELVAKSDQSMIARYLDIILESGSGPTVQEALKNPALFSMVIQLSGLAFAHESEYLANAIVEAIERIVRESGGDVDVVPDFVSLSGTLQACQQQTAAFRWALLYEAAEEKIHQAVTRPVSPESRSGSRKREEHPMTECRDLREREDCDESDRTRALQIPVLQGLFMWLQSLQNFPEHRLLHLRCNTGLSTVVVWCHHILGLSLILNVRETEIRFGNGPYNLLVDHCSSKDSGVSLMDPLDPQEPLFTLQHDEYSIGMSFDHRAEAYGYGKKFLQFERIPEWQWETLIQWVVYRSIEACEVFGTSDMFPDPCGMSPYKTHDLGQLYPSRNRLLTAGRFLFALDKGSKSYYPVRSLNSLKPIGASVRRSVWTALVLIVITFARISEDDLTRCKEMPLALNVLPSFADWQNTKFKQDFTRYINLIESFEILSLLLLGRHAYHNYAKPAVLLSAWGWSVYLDSIDAVDPVDVSVNTLRVMRGVPSRRGFRRTRIVDGPQGAKLRSLRYPSRTALRVYVAEGVATTEKGAILVGHHSDAFQVTQQFTCLDEGTSTHGCGFREMAEWSIKSSRPSPCQCYKSQGHSRPENKAAVIDEVLAEKDCFLEKIETAKGKSPGPERVLSSKDRAKSFVYISNNPAARWLQLKAMYDALENSHPYDYIALVGPDTCLECAVRDSKNFPPNGVFLL